MTNTAPGIFCYAGGAGQAAATNAYADQSVTYNQARPATPGSYLTFFITGEGQMTPPWPTAAAERAAIPKIPQRHQRKYGWSSRPTGSPLTRPEYHLSESGWVIGQAA